MVSLLQRLYLLSLELSLRLRNRLDMLLLIHPFDVQLLSYPPGSSNLVGYPLVDLNSTHQLASIRHSTLLQGLDELLASWLRHLFPLSLELQLHLWNHLDMLLLTHPFDVQLLSYPLASSNLTQYFLATLNSILVLVSTDHSMPLQLLDEPLVSVLQRLYLLSLELRLLPWNHLDTLLLTLQFDVQL